MAELKDARPLPALERVLRVDLGRRFVALDDHDAVVAAAQRERDAQPRDPAAHDDDGFAGGATRAAVKRRRDAIRRLGSGLQSHSEPPEYRLLRRCSPDVQREVELR